MRQYQEDVENKNLNEVAFNRPRVQLVLGIQQENMHIRTFQQEIKELQAPRDQAGEHSQARPPGHQQRAAPYPCREDQEGVLDGRRDEGGGQGGRGELGGC